MDKDLLGRKTSAKSRVFTYEEVALKLGVPVNTVRVAVLSKRVAAIRQDEGVRIPEAELLKWEERFTRLNSDFAWLQPILEAADTRVATVDTTVAANHLGTPVRNLNRWCQQGLLPFFVRSFTVGGAEGGKDHRALVKPYVQGLLAFACDTRPVRMRAVRDYFEVCRRNKKVM